MHFRLNTSNLGKLAEFRSLFKEYGITLTETTHELREIDADPITVIAHKASQLEEGVIVEDTTLDIEDAAIGVNIKWLLEHLSQYIGHKATWTVLLAYKKDNVIHIYEGKVLGIIVKPRGDKGFGFDPVFCPEGSPYTLAEDKPNRVNARALAVEALIQGNALATVEPIYEWNGPWQNEK